MVDTSITYAEDATLEAQQFARSIKIHGLDSHEALTNHFALIEQEKGVDQDKKLEEEAELKKAEMGEVMFQFLLYEDTDDVKGILDAVDEHVTNNISSRQHTTGKALLDDYTNVSGRISAEQHSRNRDVIREIVESCA